MFFSFLRVLYSLALRMLPLLVVGFLAAGILAWLFRFERVKKHFTRPGFRSVFNAALFGVPIPLCSCSVIPAAAALREEGASKGATGAFLISTPQTGADNFILVWNMLGWPAAIAKALVAFISGIAAGTLIDFCRGSSSFAAEKVRGKETETPRAAEKCCCHCCAHAPAKVETPPTFFVFALSHAWKMSKRMWKSLIVGIIIAAALEAFLPADFGAFINDKVYLQFIAAAIIALPLYVCSNGAVPIAMALISRGVTPGAALVFLVLGPAFNSLSIITLWKTLGVRAAAIAITVTAAIAILAGVVFNIFI